MSESSQPAPAPRRHPALRRGVWLAAVLILFVLGILTDRVVDALRGRPVRNVAEGGSELAVPEVSSSAFADVAGALTGATISEGHRIELLTDTVLFQRLAMDLAGAERSITLHLYFCEAGRLGERIADVLAERARAGVRVYLLADGFACRSLIESVGPRLEVAGANVALLRPPRWYALHRVQHRNHARLAVIDGEIAYTGGFGVADEWIGSGGEPPWRDTSVRFSGPSVRNVQAAFFSAWAEATGTLHAGEALFLRPIGDSLAGRGFPEGEGLVRAGLLYSQPGIGTTAAERAFALSVTGARRTLFIANAYFVPTPLMLSLLESAARRGVDVRLLLPGPRTDVASTRWAGRSYYGELLAAGVHIYEYQGTMMHAKTMVADGIWSVIGSMNLDNRSTRLNDEAALLIHDAEVGATMDSIFLGDLTHAISIEPVAYRARPRWERFLEWATGLVGPLL